MNEHSQLNRSLSSWKTHLDVLDSLPVHQSPSVALHELHPGVALLIRHRDHLPQTQVLNQPPLMIIPEDRQLSRPQTFLLQDSTLLLPVNDREPGSFGGVCVPEIPHCISEKIAGIAVVQETGKDLNHVPPPHTHGGCKSESEQWIIRNDTMPVVD